jgi:hypothetical protein
MHQVFWILLGHQYPYPMSIIYILGDIPIGIYYTNSIQIIF